MKTLERISNNHKLRHATDLLWLFLLYSYNYIQLGVKDTKKPVIITERGLTLNNQLIGEPAKISGE